MSIATNLQGLIDAKIAMKTSINSKGVSVPSNTKMENIADLIRQINSSSSGGSGDDNEDPDTPAPSTPGYGAIWTQSNITSTKCGNPVYGLGVWTTGNYYSTDGKNWVSCTGTYPDSSSIIVLRRYSHTDTTAGFVAYTRNNIYYSADGKSWSSVVSITSGWYVQDIKYTNYGYIAIVNPEDGMLNSICYTYSSLTGSSWSNKTWSGYIRLYDLQVTDDIAAFLADYDSRAECNYSFNLTSWSVANPTGTSGSSCESMYLASDDYLYVCFWNEQASSSNPKTAGAYVYYGRGTGSSTSFSSNKLLGSDSYDEVRYVVDEAFGPYVQLMSTVYTGTDNGTYKAGSKVSSISLTSVESKIRTRLQDNNDDDWVQVSCKSYSSSGTTYYSVYLQDRIDSITYDNGTYLDEAGYYSTDGSTWNAVEDEDERSLSFTVAPTYASSGIWVAKSTRGLVYSTTL